MHHPAARPLRAPVRRRQDAPPPRCPFVLALLPLLFSLNGAPAHAGGTGQGSAAQPPGTPPQPIDAELEEGVSEALASTRSATLADVRYALRLSIPNARADRVRGAVGIQFTTRAPLDRVVLDFAGAPDSVAALRVDGQPLAPRVEREHIIVTTGRPLAAGRHDISLEFESSDAALNRSDEFLYSLFVPARARYAFPCFDQPDLKARFTLTLEVPAEWEALSNAPENAATPPGGGAAPSAPGRRTLAFAETQPLSTYLFAFAAGRLSVESATRDGRTFRMFHRETDAAKLARNRDTIFDLHAAALGWLERYTGIAYPWRKFDFFLVPAFQFGGMEHAGAIFYNAPALLLEPSATTNQLLGRASLVAHETAHMWFGDLVTMRWFDDVWMKEVFANFMAAKIVNPSFPAINHELRFLFSHYPAAYEVDRTAGTHPIRQPLDNLQNAGSLYGAIIYQKAPIVMRQLEKLLGEDGLRDGLRQYLTTHQWGNASWADLIRLLDHRTPEDLAAWSRIWVEDLGRPTVRIVAEHDSTGVLARLRIVQDDSLRAAVGGPGASTGPRVWPQLLHVTIGLREKAPIAVRTFEVRLRDRETIVPEAAGVGPVAFILGAGGGLGYARFELDDGSRAWLLQHLPEIADPLTRGSAWVTLWDELLGGTVSPLEFLRLARAAVPREPDELNLQRVLGYGEHVFWRFLAARQREEHSVAFEDTLRAGLAAAPAGTVKAAWFNTFVRVATTRAGLEWLERVWLGTERVEGLTLAETDMTRLALELAVRGVSDAESILDGQLARIENPDRKARFAFVRPALSRDPASRARFFDSLSDAENRRREPWVLEALSYLHHPLRALESERFVRPSLDLLQTIQRTGDIFFPKRWIDVTLSGHQSARVSRTVRDFLAEHPEYPVRLRRIVLQSADELFRAAAIVPQDTGTGY